MAITAVTVTGTATFAGGEPCPGAVVSFAPDELFSQTGTTVSVAQEVFANANGAWTATVNATDDVGTLPAGGGYYVKVQDPSSGAHLDDFRAPVPRAATSTTISVLRGLAF